MLGIARSQEVWLLADLGVFGSYEHEEDFAFTFGTINRYGQLFLEHTRCMYVQVRVVQQGSASSTS